MGAVASKFVDVEGMRTHYLEAGKGFPLVLLHSGEFGGCAELSWELNLPALSEHFHVIAPDWLGFGELAKIFSFDDMVALRIRHIGALLKLLGIETGALHRQLDGRRRAGARGRDGRAVLADRAHGACERGRFRAGERDAASCSIPMTARAST